MGSSFKDFVRARQAQKAGAAAPPPERGLVAAGPGSRVPQFVGGGGGAPPNATSSPAKSDATPAEAKSLLFPLAIMMFIQ